MPVYQLLEDHIGFPPVEEAEDTGLLAVGGDLSSSRLVEAYAQGIFPWYNEDEPILWWSPDPRMVLFPHKFKLHKSLARNIKKYGYRCCFDHDFEAVIAACAHTLRPEQEGTWIVPDMQQAYTQLHKEGWAHSVEVYDDSNTLVGGLYGVAIGKAFFGESMFFKKNDASKAALYYLCAQLHAWGFLVIDVQQETAHLRHMGAELIARKDFIDLIQEAQAYPTCLGKWTINNE